MIPWIQVYSNVVAHPKTTRLAEELELKSGCVHPRIVAVGMLVAIWTWAVQNAYDGDLSRVSPTVIAEACRWKKAPRKLWDALVASGYLDADGHLHDWDEYAVLFMEAKEREREKTAARMRLYRERKRAKRYGNVTVTLRESYAPTIPYQNHTIDGDDNDDTSFLSERVREKTELQPSEAVAIRRGGATERADIGACGDEAERRLLGRERVRESLPCVKGGGEAKTGDPVATELRWGEEEQPSGRISAQSDDEAERGLRRRSRKDCTVGQGAVQDEGGQPLSQPAADSSPYTGEPCEGAQGSHESEDIDAAVSAAIRRRWGRDADERDLARGRREFVFFGENGLQAYDAALVDYVFSVSEGAGEKAQNWRFVEGVMRKLRQRGIVTVEEALDYEAERK